MSTHSLDTTGTADPLSRVLWQRHLAQRAAQLRLLKPRLPRPRNAESDRYALRGLVVIGLGVMSLLGKGFSGAQLLDRPAASLAGSYAYGATFALGWTACVGPILGALYTLLLSTQGLAIVQGAILAFIYALGLGTPLILVAAFFSRLGSGSRFWALMRGRGVEVNLGFTTLHLHTTSVISGLLLIGVGILLASGQLTVLSQWSQSTPLGQWAVSLEEGIYRLFGGR